MSEKILSQAGISLADVYDVEGSKIDIERLDEHDVKLVHEMGSTVFSERLGSIIALRSTIALAQDLNWDIELTDLAVTPNRIMSLAIIAVTDRVLTTSVAVRDPIAGREVPFYAWDTAVDGTQVIRFQNDGAAVAGAFLLRPSAGSFQMPQMTIGTLQKPFNVPTIMWRGTTSSFGAGTVIVTLVFQIGFAHRAGVSSFGLPVPSW